MNTTKRLVCTALPLLLVANGHAEALKEKQPNIIIILADDMGYGDVSALNKESKIHTTHIDRMAKEGILFTDAHSGSSVSSPTRYGLLTGRYSWRSTMKDGVLGGYAKPIIPVTRATIASKLKEAGYHTACIGKWHLGWNWSGVDKGADSINYSKPITFGPTTLGFDYFYGISASLDMAPYVYVENDMPTAVPDRETEGTGLKYWRKGPTAPDFVHEQTLPNMKNRAIAYIREQSHKDQPFFLYFPLPAPHTPILPTKDFQGKSGLTPYGDYVLMIDGVVGEVLSTLKEEGIDGETLVVFATDNGCAPMADIPSMQAKGHEPSGIYRGFKADLFDGGHRIPCVVRWPGGVNKGVVDQTICLTDFFRTFSTLAGQPVNDNEGEDSYDLLPLLKRPDDKTVIREATVHHSNNGEFSIRRGDWKLLISPSSGGWSAPRPESKEAKNLPPLQLYNMKDDPSETVNVC